MAELLKVCPYCGGYPAIYGIVGGNGVLVWRVRNLPEEFSTRDAAYVAWNRKVKDESETD